MGPPLFPSHASINVSNAVFSSESLAPTRRKRLKIMAVGDSLTHGTEGDFTWRFRLHEWARENEIVPEWVGPLWKTKSLSSAPKPAPPPLPGETEDPPPPVQCEGLYHPDAVFPGRHAAWWGRRLRQATEEIRVLVEEFAPDMLLVALGFNDIAWGGCRAGAMLRLMEEFVSEARGGKRDLCFAVCDVPHRTRLDGRQDLIDNTIRYNLLLPTLLRRLDSFMSPVRLVRFCAEYGCTPDGDCSAVYDGLHPNALGEYQIARAFSETLVHEFGVGSAPLNIPEDIPSRVIHVPRGVAAEAVPEGVKLVWESSFGATGYTIRTRLRGLGWSEGRYFYKDSQWLTWVLPGQVWEFQIRSEYGDSLVSNWSSVVSTTADPDTPEAPDSSTIQLRPLRHGMHVSFRHPEGRNCSNITRYNVMSVDQDHGAFPIRHGTVDPSITITNLVPNHRHFVAIESWNDAGGGFPCVSRPVIVGKETPDTPEELGVVNVDAVTVYISWLVADGAAGYSVWVRQRSSEDASFRRCCDFTEETCYTMGSLFPGTWDFEFCVTSLNGVYESPRTSPIAPGRGCTMEECPRDGPR